MPIDITMGMTATPKEIAPPERVDLTFTVKADPANSRVDVRYSLEPSHKYYFGYPDGTRCKVFSLPDQAVSTVGTKISVTRRIVEGPGQVQDPFYATATVVEEQTNITRRTRAQLRLKT